jgi:hypothetical protein
VDVFIKSFKADVIAADADRRAADAGDPNGVQAVCQLPKTSLRLGGTICGPD